MNETLLTPRQWQAVCDMRKALAAAAETFGKAATNFDQAMEAREEMDTPGEWQLPKDRLEPTYVWIKVPGPDGRPFPMKITREEYQEKIANITPDISEHTGTNFADSSTSQAVLGKNTGYVRTRLAPLVDLDTGESWQIGDHAFSDEWRKEE